MFSTLRLEISLLTHHQKLKGDHVFPCVHVCVDGTVVAKCLTDQWTDDLPESNEWL